MEFWSSLIEEKGFNLPDEFMVKNRSKVLTEEPVAVFDTTDCQFVSCQGLMESGFSDPSGRQSDSSNPSRDASSDHIDIDQYSEEVSGEKRLRSRMSGLFEENDGVNSMLPMKRGRLANSCAQKSICQVQGCCKDLSSLKDYYKRHKVCDAHTKTARVFVKGIEQRFCQQCSRFHLLAEFDDGKRSCRKRLANHNERRRKPPGIRHLNSSVRNSHLLDEMLQNSFPRSTENLSADWFNHAKPEDPGLDSTCALSLLSAQSRKDSDPFIGTSSEQILAYSSANSDDLGFSGFCSPNKALPSSSVSSDGGMNNGSNTMNGTMINLMQPSSHLEVVEHKRRIMD